MSNGDYSVRIGITSIALTIVLFFYGHVGSKYQTLQPCLAAAKLIKERCGYVGCGVGLNLMTTQALAERLVADKDGGRFKCFTFVTLAEIESIFK